ncbi:phage tail tape measure protein [Streptomyces sp. TRM68416]|uniref:phage tail tape measure protein n=1 Tax=Streptomyces sp. TRM68416 TaxID=2758412 RepID=UPI001661EB8F|nr:phage tail tape measure protein [Streptomyces sp. TRM68416]MBD0838779.1 phage tail tape measure protein [Streptomyces sp. TRM68416]
MAVLDELLVRLGVDMSEAEGEIDRGAAGIENRLTGLSAAGGIAAVGLGAAFVAGLQSAMDISSVETQLQDQLGLTADEAARAGQMAGDVFAQGWGQSLGEVGDAVGAVTSSFGELGDFADAELQEMSKSALRLADRLQVDVGESAKAAGQLVKQGLADDATEAFDVMTVAAREFPEAMRGDIPAVVAEYGKHFKQIGLDAQTSFGLMSQFVAAGGRDIDQAGDVLHEFARITTEESDRAAEAFKALKLDAGDMLADIHKGGKPAADALGLTLKALRGVKDPAKQAELGVALFGDMAGEATSALLAMDPATALAGTGLDNVTGAAAEANAALENSPAQQFDSIMRTVSMTLGEMLLPVLSFVSELLKEHPGLLQILIPVVLALAAALAVAAIAQWAMNSALLANPITIVVLLIVALIVWIVALWQKSETFREIVLGVWAAVRAGIEGAVNGILAAVGWMAALPGRIGGWFGQAKDWAIAKALELVAWLRGLPGRVSQAVSGMFSAIPSGFRSALNSVIGAWNGLSFTIGGGSFMGVDVPSFTLHTPDIPFLAEGGIVTRPTLAMIGEGGEDEAVMPLSALDRLLSTRSAVPAAAMAGPAVMTVRLDGHDPFLDWLKERIRIDFDGDVTNLNEG